MDGLEFLDWVRSDPGLAAMVFIMVTVETRDARVMQAAEEKHDAYLTKPISADKLARRLEAVLARRLTMARAGLLETEGQADRAMEEYLAMANNHPRASWPLSCLGRMLVRQGRTEEAETCYQRVLERNPRAAWARLELGRLLQSQGRIGEAHGQYQEALLNAPRFFKAYDALAESILEQGDRRGALEVLEAAVSSLGAQSAGRQALLARLRYLNRQYAGAEEAYARALALKPHAAQVGSRLGLGRSRLAQGRLEEALPALEAAAACCRGERDLEDLIDLKLLMGAVHAQRGDMEAAAGLRRNGRSGGLARGAAAL
jgi:tetratricopeptide (TPR) repeat protein